MTSGYAEVSPVRADPRVLIVTGAATGIGQALTLQLVSGGDHVVAVDIRPDGLDWAKGHPSITTHRADISTPAGNDAMVEAAMAVHGRLDGVAFNAALMGLKGSILDMPVEDVERLMSVNFYGALHGLRACAPVMEIGGAVVITTALAGLRGDPRIWAYAASKAALTSLVLSAAVDFGQRGLRVNALVPGPVAGTGQTASAPTIGNYVKDLASAIPMQRWGRPDELAAVAAFLLSSGSSYMNGALVPVDGGALAMLPWYRPGASHYLGVDTFNAVP